MDFHPNLRLLGRLELLEVYDFHDTPLFVSCRTPSGSLYFAVAVSGPKNSDSWLYVSVSQERFTHVRSGAIDLYTAFSQPENNVALLVDVPADESVDASVTPLRAGEINDDILPAKGEFLRLPTETLPQLETAAELARRTLRDIVGFKLKLPDFARSEAPAKLLGSFLAGVQDTINAIAQARRGEPARRGTFARSMLALNEMAVMRAGGGSFAIVLGSTVQPTLFVDQIASDASNALEDFVSLLSVSGHAEELQQRLAKQPRVAGHLLGMLRSIDQKIDSLSVEWASPQPGRGAGTSLSAVTVDAAIAVIEHKAPSAEREFWVVCRLVGADIEKKTFQVWSLEMDDHHYSGRISDEALETVNGAVIGDTYRAFILQIEKLKPATGDVLEETILVQLAAPGEVAAPQPDR
jgi:hypothetical protein